MDALAGLAGFVLLSIVIADAFQTVVVARHAHRLPRMTRAFFQLTWAPFAVAARPVRSARRRDKYLGIYGPLSLLLLLGLWATNLIVAFALLQWSIPLQRGGSPSSLVEDIYFSAGSFFTLGPGEPRNLASKYLVVIEAGFGFSFLGLVVSYLPVLHQSLARRELQILLFDVRAGSPPSAAEFIQRRGRVSGRLQEQLRERKSGRWTCCKASSRTRCSPTTGRSTRTNPGLRP